jgi:superfamily II DNA or RNA helicase/intein/homing endonuclease
MRTAALLTKRGNQYFKLSFPRDRELLSKLRIIYGFRKIGLNSYHLPFNEDTIDFLTDNGFIFNGAFARIKKAEYEERNPIKKIPKYKKHKLKPYKYQIEGVNHIVYHNGRALIADAMGLGKTVQALGWLQLSKEVKKVLIICPSSLKINWKKEIHKWVLRNMSIEILDGKTPYELTSDVVIVNYDILEAWREQLIAYQFDACIADEIHNCKNSKSKRTIAFKAITKLIPNLVGLTGTPIENAPMEIFHIVNLINKNIFPNYIRFIQEYCNAKQTLQWSKDKSGKAVQRKVWKSSGVTNSKKLHRILTKTVMIRRLKSDVLTQLPPKVYSTIPISIDNRKEYDKAEADFIEYVRKSFDDKVRKDLEKELKGFMDNYDIKAIDFGSHVLTNQQIKKAKREKIEAIAKAPALAKIQALKLLAAEGKMQQAISWITDFVESEEKLIVFAINKVIIDKLMGAFPDAVKIDGSVSTTKRNEVVERFQNDPKCNLFIGNIKAAGVGLTLTAASDVLILQLPWNPGELEQAEDRCILKDELIPTKNGFVKIQDIKQGDVVLTHKGNWKKVIDTHTHLERKKHFVDITYKGFWEPLRVTHDHRVFTWDKVTEKYAWIEAGNLDIMRHYLVYASNLQNGSIKKLNVQNVVSKEFVNNWGSSQQNGRLKEMQPAIKLTTKFMYALGRYLADGWCSTEYDNGSSVAICDSLDKTKEVISCSKTICKTFGLPEKITKYSSKKNVHTSYIYSKNLAILFKEWFGSGAHANQVPDFVFSVSDKLKRKFLRGYYDGDGYMRKNTQQASSVSEKIIIGISTLEAHLGNPITLRFNLKANCYSFEYSIRSKCVKETQIKNKDGNVLFPISELHKYKPKKQTERVYDLTVEDDHSFHVGYAAVHNCHRITQKKKVTIHKLIAENTIEERIMQLLEAKQAEIDRIIDGKDVKKQRKLIHLLLESYK